MLQQPLLPLTPNGAPPLLSLSHATLPTADRGEAGDVRFHRTRARRAFRKSDSEDSSRPSRRSVRALEPYRGAEHPLFSTAASLRRGRRILVRTGLASILRDEIAAGSLTAAGSSPIEIGGASEPYPSAEARFELSRSLLEVLAEARGLELWLTTRSPLLLRDQDLLRTLDLRHSVTVTVPISTSDPSLAARLEPGVADARARLAMVERLASDGIATRVLCSPILPGINSSADELGPLFAAASRAGAFDVTGDTHALRRGNRRQLLRWLQESFPSRVESVRRRLEASGPRAALGTLERLRLAHGFPALRSGRG